MKIAIVGSRNLKVNNLKKYLPKNVTEIVSGGAKGVDTSAKEYADAVIAFWDGKSKGTKYVIDRCKKVNKDIKIYVKINVKPKF